MMDLDSLIQQVDRLLREKRPDYYAQLQPGASAEMIARAERYYGFRFPPPLLALYRWKNGQATRCHKSFTGFDNLSFLSLEDAIESHGINQELDAMGEFEAGWWDSAWVPFLANGGGDHLCMEVDPEGNEQGLLWYFHDDEGRPQPDLYSIEVLLEAIAEELTGT